MKVIVMDRISYSIVSLSEVYSITKNGDVITIQGTNDATAQAATVNTTSTRSIVRIMEN